MRVPVDRLMMTQFSIRALPVADVGVAVETYFHELESSSSVKPEPVPTKKLVLPTAA